MKERQYQKWIREMFDKYKSVLFLEKYHLKIRPNNKDEDYFLASKFNYPYLDMTIVYSEKAVKDWVNDKRDAERRLIHEFCHTITDPLYSVVVNWPTKTAIEEARERLTDHIAQIINNHFNLL